MPIPVNESNTHSKANLSFAGCGFLGIYHVGVATCIKQYAPQLLTEKISGASAGALVACAVISDCCLGECTTFTLKLALQARSGTLGPLSPSFQLVKNLRQALWNFLPDNAHEIASNRLHISLTRLSDRKNVLVSQFSDKDELLDALICSSFVPLYSGVWPPSYKGVRYIDGAISDNIPVLNENTITVSPFAGESDICPDDNSCYMHHINLGGTSIQLTAGNLYRLSVAFFPPSPEILSNMCRQGFDDGLRYLRKNKLITCAQHLSIESAVISSSPIHYSLFDEEDDELIGGGVISRRYDSDDDSDDESVCDECEQQERTASYHLPPIQVEQALQAACDEINQGLLAKVYNNRAFQVASLVAVPYFLPFEISYLVVRKLYEWSPYMSDDMQWFVKQLYRLVSDLLHSLHSNSSLSDWEVCGIRLNLGMHWGLNVRRRRKKSSSILTPTIDRRSVVTYSGPVDIEAPDEEQSVAVNFGINLNYGIQNSPLRCVNEVRQHLLDSDETGAVTSSVATASASGGDNINSCELQSLSEVRSLLSQAQPPGAVQNIARPHVHRGAELYSVVSADSSFEECLNVATQMDSILAYYYQEEKNPNQIKVVEIFPLQRSNPLQASGTEGRTHKKSRASMTHTHAHS